MTKQEFMKKHGPGSEDKACSDALDWIASLPKTYNAKQIWNDCKRPDWMLWYLERTIDNNDQRFRLMACAFVRRTPVGDGKFVWDLLSDNRSKRVVEVAELYAVGKATDEELAAARSAAWDAYADTWAAWDAARATANAYAAAAELKQLQATERFPRNAANAYAAAAAARAAANAYDAYAVALIEQCNIIREFFPEP